MSRVTVLPCLVSFLAGLCLVPAYLWVDGEARRRLGVAESRYKQQVEELSEQVVYLQGQLRLAAGTAALAEQGQRQRSWLQATRDGVPEVECEND